MAFPDNVVTLRDTIEQVRTTIGESKALVSELPKFKARRKRINLKILARVETLPAVLATLNCFLADNQSEIVTLILNVLPD